MTDAFVSRAAKLERADEELRRQHDILEVTVKNRTAELELANRELAARDRRNQLLTELTGLLQTVRDVEEAVQVMPRFLGPIFAPHAGAVYLTKSSLNYLELLQHWGKVSSPATLEISDCWGLRRGQPYLVEDSRNALVCRHLGEHPDGHAYLCLPMMAQGSTIGLLHLAFATGDTLATQAWREHARLVAEQLALALANLKLRDALREQSIRDVLTGLHNRRFLEETLARELARAEREKHSLAAFMLDVDHFKRFNDQHGHEAWRRGVARARACVAGVGARGRHRLPLRRRGIHRGAGANRCRPGARMGRAADAPRALDGGEVGIAGASRRHHLDGARDVPRGKRERRDAAAGRGSRALRSQARRARPAGGKYGESRAGGDSMIIAVMLTTPLRD